METSNEKLVVPDCLPSKYQRVLHGFVNPDDAVALCGFVGDPYKIRHVDQELEKTWPKCSICKRIDDKTRSDQ